MSAPEFTLVEATSDDAPELGRLSGELYDAEGASPRDPANLVTTMQAWLTTWYRAVIIRCAGRTAGYAMWREDVDHTYLRHFFVDASLRGNGLGGAVFETLRARWLPQDLPLFLDVLTGNDAGAAFWSRMQFKQVTTGFAWQPQRREGSSA